MASPNRSDIDKPQTWATFKAFILALWDQSAAAEGFQNAAGASAARADSSASSVAAGAARLFADDATGLAATAEGSYYSILSGLPYEVSLIKHKVGGAAIDTGKRTPDAASVVSLTTRASNIEIVAAQFKARYEAQFISLPSETGYLNATVDSVGRAIELVGLDGTIYPQKIALPDVTPMAGVVFQALPVETGYSEVLVDSVGRMIRATPLSGAVQMTVTRALKADNGGSPNGPRENTNYVVAPFTDATGKRQLCSLRKSDGKRSALTSLGNNSDPFVTSAGIVLYNSDATGVDVQRWIPVAGGVGGTLIARKKIYAFGDSMSQDTYQSALAAATGVEVSAQGIASQTSSEIVARQGGVPVLLTVNDNSIPASGTVSVTAWSQDFLASKNSPAATLAMTGTLAGVEGTLTKTGSPSTYSFARTGTGPAIACPVGTPFVTDLGVEARDAIGIMWAGTNDVIYGGSAAGLQANVNAAVVYNSCYIPQQLVIGPFNRSTQPVGGVEYQMVVAMEASLAANASANHYAFFNLRSFIIDNRVAVAAAMGIVLTSQDATDAANDLTPTSFRADSTHLTAAVSAYVGNTIFRNQLASLGWI